MCKEGWCVRLGREGVDEGGWNCLKYLKWGWNRKKGRGNKDFKKGGGKLGQGVGALKRGGPPYELCKVYALLGHQSIIVSVDIFFPGKGINKLVTEENN